MEKIVVITGAGAGVGRATVEKSARRGCDEVLAPAKDRLAWAVAQVRHNDVRALPISIDMADAKAVEAATANVEKGPGPIDVRVVRTLEAEPGSVQVVMVLEMDLPDMGSIRTSGGANINIEAHETTLVPKPFSGRFFHLSAERRCSSAVAQG